jgi:hypothetical protein
MPTVSNKLVNQYLTRNNRLTSPILFKGKKNHMNYTQGQHSGERRLEQTSTHTYDQRKIWDGTSEREINKALSTYLNNTGPADYQLPNLVGNMSVISGTINNPQWTLRKKSKPGYFPHYKTELAGQSSPAASKYSPR